MRECPYCGKEVHQTSYTTRIYCSLFCQREFQKLRMWLNAHNIEVAKDNASISSLRMRYQSEKLNWASGDVNVLEGDIRERVKKYRTLGMTYHEIHTAMHITIGTVYSVLEHEI